MPSTPFSAGEAFPWHVGIYDAHCHPTDVVTSVARVGSMRARSLVIMASRRQDQHLVDSFARQIGWKDGESQDGRVIPSFGWHPWFSHQIIIDNDMSLVAPANRIEHYQSVITPRPDDEDFLASLPEPVTLSSVLAQTRSYLHQYPYALVGEVGLDRAFRIPGIEMLDPARDVDPEITPGSRDGRKLSRYQVSMDHQRRILIAQLHLAGQMQRPVSVHGVSAHGTLYDTLASTWKGYEKESRRKSKQRAAESLPPPFDEIDEVPETVEKPFPPRVCLHSFSGQPDALRQYLNPRVPAIIYFSFSTLVNFSSKSKKAEQTIKAVPDDRILIESDLHVAGDQMDRLLEDITRRICEIKGWSLFDGASQLASNWQKFVFGSV